MPQQDTCKLLTLVVPTYNMEKYLPRCLDSVTGPSIPSTLEVIVVNDGSRDRSLDIMEAYREKWPGIVRVIAWMRRSEFGSIKLCFDILMVTLAVESSLIMFHGLDGVREGTVVAMLLIGPLVRMLTRWMHAEPEIRNDSDQGSTGS